METVQQELQCSGCHYRNRRVNKTILTANYLLAAGNLYIMKYTIYPDGMVHADITFTSTDMKAASTEVSEATLMATFTPGQDAQRLASSKLNVPRIGVRFRLPSDMNQVEYFGADRKNFIDRNASSFVDLYRSCWVYIWSAVWCGEVDRELLALRSM